MKNRYPFLFWYISSATGLRYIFRADNDREKEELILFYARLEKNDVIYRGKDNLLKYGFIDADSVCKYRNSITKTAIKLPTLKELARL